ncbi:MAG: peptidylprolyl isomerase [Acidimicrobiales bacterium]
MPKSRILAPLVVVGVLAVACGSSAGDALSDPVSTVNEAELSEEELEDRILASIPPEALDPPQSDDPTVPTVTAVDPDTIPPQEQLTRWIVEQLVFDELETRDVQLTEGDLLNGQYLTAPGATDDLVQTSAGQVRLAYELSDLDQPTTDDIDQWIIDNPPVVNTCVSHIIVDTEADAEAVVVELEGGADFAELAMEVSVGPSAPQGGELGCVAPGQFVPEFETAMNEAELNVATAPVESEFGWHVILVTEREVGQVDESSQELARRSILAEDLESLRGVYLQFLIDSEEQVWVDPRYGTWNAADGVVVPPEGSDPPGIDATIPDGVGTTTIPVG